MSQSDRLLRALQERSMTSLEIIQELYIINTTGRISDLRKRGHRIDCRKDDRGYDRYYLVMEPVQPTLEAIA